MLQCILTADMYKSVSIVSMKRVVA